MDTGEPQDAVPKAGPKGKKKKKEGKKTLTLDQFLQSHGNSEPKSANWATLTEPDDESESVIKFDRSTLPTAPKAAMGPKYNEDDIPRDGPFSAHLGNVSYDANEVDLENFFGGLNVLSVRLISDNGRPRGYAYVDFTTREDLIEALTYHEREFMGRPIRVDLATSKDNDGRSGGRDSGRSNEPDRTEGDWRRRGPPEEPAGGRGGFDRDRGGGGGFGDRDRDRGGFGDRDRGGGFGDRDRGGGFGDRDRGGFGDRDRGFGDRDRGSGFGDRDRDRGFGDRDRDRDFGGDRDRDRGFGGDRDRDRGFGGDRDRDRGFGGDRDRERGYGGDRDRGFGDRDRDRGYGGDRDKDRDRGYGEDRDRGFGGDRERSNRGYGFNRDRDDGGRFGGSRDDRYGGRRDDYGGGRRDQFGGGRRDDYDRRPASREGSADAPKTRPVLKLQPRSKPTEDKENKPSATATRAPSIFGAAKPVDTTAREKEIEEKLKKAPPPDDQRRPRRGEAEGRDQGSWRRNAEPEGSDGPQRRDSDNSQQSGEGSQQGEGAEEATSPPPATKMMPAPLPKENPWTRKKEGTVTTGPAAVSPSSAVTSDRSNNAAPREDRREPPAQRPSNAWGRGRGRSETDNPPERRPVGDRSNTGYKGFLVLLSSAGNGGNSRRLPREKHIPQSLDEMPKYEEKSGKDFYDQNKFAFLDAAGSDGEGADDPEDVVS